MRGFLKMMLIMKSMKNKVLIGCVLVGIFLIVFVVFAQRNPAQKLENVNEAKLSYSGQILDLLESRFVVKEIAKPNLVLPASINDNQIKKYFKIENLMFALVLNNSTNVELSLPTNFTPTFVGVLVAKKGDIEWSKLVEIKDLNSTSKNNPYYLIVENKKLLLTVVDQNGAGSGEGIMKLFALSKINAWDLEGCYSFGGNYNGPSTDGDYFAYSAIFSKQVPQSIKSCNNVNLITNE